MEHSLIGPAAAVAARGSAGDVMEHIAHHVHPGVPLANMRSAEAPLKELIGDCVVDGAPDASTQRRIAARYKLYDYNRRRWLDFKGHPTSPPAMRTPVSTR